LVKTGTKMWLKGQRYRSKSLCRQNVECHP